MPHFRFLSLSLLLLAAVSIVTLGGCASAPKSAFEYSPPAASTNKNSAFIEFGATPEDIERALPQLLRIFSPSYHETSHGRLLMVFDHPSPDRHLDCGTFTVRTPADGKESFHFAGAQPEAIFPLADTGGILSPVRRQTFLRCTTELLFSPSGPGITGVRAHSVHTMDVALSRYVFAEKQDGAHAAPISAVTEKDRVTVGGEGKGQSTHPVPVPGEFLTGETGMLCVPKGDFEAEIILALGKLLKQ